MSGGSFIYDVVKLGVYGGICIVDGTWFTADTPMGAGFVLRQTAFWERSIEISPEEMGSILSKPLRARPAALAKNMNKKQTHLIFESDDNGKITIKLHPQFLKNNQISGFDNNTEIGDESTTFLSNKFVKGIDLLCKASGRTSDPAHKFICEMLGFDAQYIMDSLDASDKELMKGVDKSTTWSSGMTEIPNEWSHYKFEEIRNDFSVDHFFHDVKVMLFNGFRRNFNNITTDQGVNNYDHSGKGNTEVQTNSYDYVAGEGYFTVPQDDDSWVRFDKEVYTMRESALVLHSLPVQLRKLKYTWHSGLGVFKDDETYTADAYQFGRYPENKFPRSWDDNERMHRFSPASDFDHYNPDDDFIAPFGVAYFQRTELECPLVGMITSQFNYNVYPKLISIGQDWNYSIENFNPDNQHYKHPDDRGSLATTMGTATIDPTKFAMIFSLQNPNVPVSRVIYFDKHDRELEFTKDAYWKTSDISKISLVLDFGAITKSVYPDAILSQTNFTNWTKSVATDPTSGSPPVDNANSLLLDKYDSFVQSGYEDEVTSDMHMFSRQLNKEILALSFLTPLGTAEIITQRSHLLQTLLQGVSSELRIRIALAPSEARNGFKFIGGGSEVDDLLEATVFTIGSDPHLMTNEEGVNYQAYKIYSNQTGLNEYMHESLTPDASTFMEYNYDPIHKFYKQSKNHGRFVYFSFAPTIFNDDGFLHSFLASTSTSHCAFVVDTAEIPEWNARNGFLQRVLTRYNSWSNPSYTWSALSCSGLYLTNTEEYPIQRLLEASNLVPNGDVETCDVVMDAFCNKYGNNRLAVCGCYESFDSSETVREMRISRIERPYTWLGALEKIQAANESFTFPTSQEVHEYGIAPLPKLGAWVPVSDEEGKFVLIGTEGLLRNYDSGANLSTPDYKEIKFTEYSFTETEDSVTTTVKGTLTAPADITGGVFTPPNDKKRWFVIVRSNEYVASPTVQPNEFRKIESSYGSNEIIEYAYDASTGSIEVTVEGTIVEINKSADVNNDNVIFMFNIWEQNIEPITNTGNSPLLLYRGKLNSEEEKATFRYLESKYGSHAAHRRCTLPSCTKNVAYYPSDIRASLTDPCPEINIQYSNSTHVSQKMTSDFGTEFHKSDARIRSDIDDGEERALIFIVIVPLVVIGLVATVCGIMWYRAKKQKKLKKKPIF